MKNYFARIYHRFHISKRSRGFTLVELLLAISIGTIILVVASFALVTITSFDNKAEAKIERQIDLNRAFDFMTHEIRMARRINRTATEVANGSTVSVEDVVTNSGLNVTTDIKKPPSNSKLVLYLEIPITNIPASCPSPVPTDYNSGYDRVIYDIRPTTGSWLSPMVIARYGRIPSADGSINPCKFPITSDILVDSVSDTDINPTCTSPAIKFGAGGFYACVNGSLVDLFLRGAVGNTENQDVTGRAFSRQGSYSNELAPVLSGTRQAYTPPDPDPHTMNLSWTWGGTGSATFKVYRTVDGVAQLIYTYNGSTLSFSDSSPTSGKQNCYTVRATIGSYTSAPSNAKCENF
jgi:prepilin-type N-terminal cleavage/methylation domain-containing protein